MIGELGGDTHLEDDVEVSASMLLDARDTLASVRDDCTMLSARSYLDRALAEDRYRDVSSRAKGELRRVAGDMVVEIGIVPLESILA